METYSNDATPSVHLAMTPSSRLSQLRLDTPSAEQSRTRYFACQPAEDFATKWERTFTSEHQQNHPNLSMVLDSDKICFEHRQQTHHEKYTIDPLFDIDMQLPEQYLDKDEHYDPTASWLDQIYCEDDEDDGDVTMEEDEDDSDDRCMTANDDDGDTGEENRRPRQWRSRRRQKPQPKPRPLTSMQQHPRAPLQELPLEDDDRDQHQDDDISLCRRKYTARRGSLRLMRSLSPPAGSNAARVKF